MFGLGLGEIAVILILALIFVGPKRLPEVGRKIGEFYRQFRDAADTVRSSMTSDFEEPSITQKVMRPPEKKEAVGPEPEPKSSASALPEGKTSSSDNGTD